MGAYPPHYALTLKGIIMSRQIFILIKVVLLMFGSAQKAVAESAYDFSFSQVDGSMLNLADFKGKVVMVVNTASACGFTDQYDDMQALYEKYQDQGFVMLAVPSNDFGSQEPLSGEKITEFCEVNFNTTFTVTDKVVVKGDDAHPFYRWAADELGTLAKPRWNFHKYLIDRNGNLVNWFATPTKPTANKVKQAVEALL